MELLTHDWMIANKFHHHKSTKLDMYIRDGFTYVRKEDEEFGIRIQNFIKQNPIKTINDMILFHKLISGVDIMPTLLETMEIKIIQTIDDASDKLNTDEFKKLSGSLLQYVAKKIYDEIHTNLNEL